MTEKLEIIRHQNGKIKSLVCVDLCTEYPIECNDDGYSRYLRNGPFIIFDKKGKIEKIGVYDSPTCFVAGYADSLNWRENFLWSKEFDSNGNVTETSGKEGKFELSSEMQEILKKEKLLPAVNKALAAEKAPTLKSTLKRGTKSPRKKAGKEM